MLRYRSRARATNSNNDANPNSNIIAKVNVPKITRRILFWAAVIFLAVSVIFPVIAVPVWSSYGASYYKSSFDSSQKNGVISLSLDEWADYFPGSSGLSHLQQLSQDPALMPSGRRIATETADFISSGKHQPHLARILKNAWYVWPLSCAVAYVYLEDGIKTGNWTTEIAKGEDLYPR
jgi:hypothetical protein